MLIKVKTLMDGTWRDIVAKHKAKDNGLLKALDKLKRVDEDDHAAAVKVLDEVAKLAAQGRKDKALGGIAPLAKHLTEMVDAAEALQRDLDKAQAEREKAAAREAAEKKAADRKAADKQAAEQKAAAQKAAADDGEDDEAPTPELLTTRLKPLVKLALRGEPLHVLVARVGKEARVLLARTPISASRRKLLATALDSSSAKFYRGRCGVDHGALVLTLDAEVAGLAKLVRLAVLEQTGLRVGKLRCRGQDGVEDHDDGGDDDDDKRPGQDDAAARGLENARRPHDGLPEDIPVGPGGEAPPEHRGAGSGGDADGDGGEHGDAAPAVGMARPFDIAASVGRGGKNAAEDVSMVQLALNRRLNARLQVDGVCGSQTIAAITAFQKRIGQSRPDGRVDPGRATALQLAKSGKLPPPPPPLKPMAPPEDLGEPTVARAPLVWKGTRGILGHNIGELKRAVLQEYSGEHPTLLRQIDAHVQRVDVILERLDDRLSATLERANAAAGAAERKAEIAQAKAILKEYVGYVKAEPLIGQVDGNPFGVQTQLRKVIGDSLAHLVKSVAKG